MISLFAQLDQIMATRRDAIAIVAGDRHYRYDELQADVFRMQQWLQQQALPAQAVIGIYVQSRYHAIVSIIACLRSGYTYLPLDPVYPHDRLVYMVDNASAACVLHDGEALHGSASTQKDMRTAFTQSASISAPINAADDAQLGYIIYTSGSTGKPKGVMLPLSVLSHLIDWQNAHYATGSAPRTLQFSALSFDVSFQEIFSTLSLGATLYLLDDNIKKDFHRLVKFVDEHRIERMFMPYIALLNFAQWATRLNCFPSALSEVVTAGEALVISDEIRTLFTQLPQCRLSNQYGPSESHVVTEYLLPADRQQWPALPAIGRAIDRAEIVLLNDEAQPVATGEVGEIYISGPVIARGYINNDDETQKRFVDITINGRTQRAYRTGDLAAINSNGDLDYKGRADNQVKISGYRIELSEVEVALLKLDGLQEAAVAAITRDNGQRELAAFVVAPHADPAGWRETLARDLPAYMVPSHFVVREQLLKTASGKIDRKSMADAFVQTLPSHNVSAPTVALNESHIIQLISNELGVATLNRDISLLDQGLDSLKSNRLSGAFYDQFGVDIPAYQFFQHANVNSLLKYVLGKSAQASTAPQRRSALNDQGQRDIAIIGMAVNVPGASTVQQFWQNLLDNKDTVHFFEPTQNDRVNARGILADATGFDTTFFGISPLEARVIDPQQRVLLELAWHALEDAGVVPEQFGGRIGVFCGTGNNSYYLNNVLKNSDVMENYGAFQAMIANEKDYAATRIAHRLNLNGPALSIVTACSTSLVAVCSAVESIRAGQCEMAIAGAASITFPQQQPHQHEEGSILSRDGYTRTFDKDGSGTVFSDGAGMVVLKRLDFARDDGDRIYAVIKGAAVNNDGGEKASFSAPSVLGQKRLLLAAQQDAQISADQLSYIEAHGTATPLGDPIEVDALRSAFAENSQGNARCGLGSVKSNFGHLTAAAGVVGLIKTALSAHHGVIPASLHFTEANPQLRLAQSPFYVVDKNQTWDKTPAQRIAGVSSFGIGGTNAHLIVAGVEHEAKQDAPQSWLPLCLSAKSSAAVTTLATLYQQHNVGSDDVLQQRATWPWRLALPSDANGHIQWSTDITPTQARSQHRVVLLFPGQGTQQINMAHGLYQHVPPFKTEMDRCFAILQQQHQLDFAAVLFRDDGDITATQYAQLGLFCVGYSLAKTLEQMGVQAETAMGHSIGEIVAATIADVFTLEQALRVVFTRGRVMQQQPAGSMAAVRAEFRDIQHLLPDTVTLAAENAAQSITISGPSDDVREACERLKLHAIQCKPLQTSHAFHSAMMQGAAEQFRHQLVDLQLKTPRFRFASCVTGEWIRDEQATSIDYWAQQIVQPVRFKKCAELIADWSHVVAIECGPKQTINGLLAQVAQHDVDAVPLLPRADGSADEVIDFSAALAQLWTIGLPIVWPLSSRQLHGRASLPLYPFQHQTLAVVPDGASPVLPANSTLASNEVPQESVTMSAVIIDELKNLFAQASGLDMSQANTSASFFELGLDSLFLTQSIAKIKKQYGVNISFRELLKDYNNLNALATYLASKNPAKAAAAPVAAPVAVSAPASVAAVAPAPAMTSAPIPFSAPVMPAIIGQSNPDLMAVIAAQMQVLSQQLALLGGQAVAAPVAVSAPVTTAPAVTAAAPIRSNNDSNTPRKPFGAAVRINVKRSNDMTEVQAANYQKLSQVYNDKFKSSKVFAQANRHHLADPRVVSGFRTPLKEIIYPIVVDRSEGSKLWDIDGNQFIDITCGFGSNFFGNGAPFIKKAVAEQLERGYEIGPQNPMVAETAQLFCDITGAERVAFCNTGSEAVLGAVRLARTVTSKDAVVMFENDYHGINDEVIVHRAANGHASPAAAGVPESAVANTMMLDYGEKASLDYIREHAHEIAAVLIEPVQSRKPLLQPKEFLKELRQICTDNDIAMIFDEVITGFRIHSGGAQGYYGIQADLASWGKVVGGGMPIGVISGKAKFMDALDGGQWKFGDDSQPEVGVTYFAGTFVRHPLALAAARAVLRHLKNDPQVQDRLSAKTTKMVERMNAISASLDAPVQVANCASLFRFVIPQEIAFEELIYVIMRRNGLHVWDARPCFLTTAHTDEDIDQIVNIFEQALHEMMRCEFFAPTEKFKAAAKNKLQMDASQPPVPGARLGKDESGKPAWFVPDPEQAGKYRKLVS